MRITIHQPAYMPYLGLMGKIMNSDIYICLDHVQFSKNSFDNRNKISTGDKVKWLTVPVKTKGKFKNNPLNKAEVSWEGKDWRKEHLFALRHFYPMSAKLADYYSSLYDFLFFKKDKLMYYQEASTQGILEHLDMDYKPIYSSQLDPQNTGSELILELCKKAGATEYLSGAMGRDYLDLESFKKAGIEVLFYDWDPQYTLSALHYLVTKGPVETRKMIEKYGTINKS